MEELQVLLVNTLIGVATGLILLGGAYLNKFLKKALDKVNAETNKIDNENQKEFINRAIENLNGLVTRTVLATQTTLVEGLKKASEDGKLSKEDAEVVKNSVFELVKGQLSDDAKIVLGIQISDLDKYIDTEIEVALAKVRGQIDSSFKF